MKNILMWVIPTVRSVESNFVEIRYFGLSAVIRC